MARSIKTRASYAWLMKTVGFASPGSLNTFALLVVPETRVNTVAETVG